MQTQLLQQLSQSKLSQVLAHTKLVVVLQQQNLAAQRKQQWAVQKPAHQQMVAQLLRSLAAQAKQQWAVQRLALQQMVALLLKLDVQVMLRRSVLLQRRKLAPVQKLSTKSNFFCLQIKKEAVSNGAASFFLNR